MSRLKIAPGRRYPPFLRRKEEGRPKPQVRTPFTPPNKPKNQEAFGLVPQLSQHLHFWPQLSAQHLLLQQVVVVAQDDFVLHIEAQPVRSDALRAKDRNRYFMVISILTPGGAKRSKNRAGSGPHMIWVYLFWSVWPLLRQD